MREIQSENYDLFQPNSQLVGMNPVPDGLDLFVLSMVIQEGRGREMGGGNREAAAGDGDRGE